MNQHSKLILQILLQGLLAVGVNADFTKPNIIFIMADDIGYGDFHCYNPQGRIATPNIDRLARGGMRFTDAHTPAAVCAPTRYSVLTGNYPWRGRSPLGTWRWNRAPQIPPDQKTVGHLLQAAGYRTAMLGKSHLGSQFEKLADGMLDFTKPMKTGPLQWGFDYSHVLLSGHQEPPYMYFENNQLAGDPSKIVTLLAGVHNGGKVAAPGPGLPDWDSRKVGQTLVEKALAFMQRERANPFYIHLSTDGAHSPFSPPETLLGTPIKGVTRMTAKADMVREVDVITGKIVEALEKFGLMDRTLIVITSDNGGISNPANLAFGHDSLGGLHGSKSYIWEGGHRVPFVAYWKGRIPPGTVRNQLIGTHDIVPTFVELAGGGFEPELMRDSVSLAPVLLGEAGDDQPVRQTLLIQSSPGRDALTEPDPETATDPETEEPAMQAGENSTTGRRWLAGSHGMAHALREGPWKLVFDIEHDRPAALYNLTKDPGERQNLIAAATESTRVNRMEALYRGIRTSDRSTPNPAAPEFSIEHPKHYKLPYRDAKSGFGTVAVGRNGRTKTFTIKNPGSIQLTNLAISKDGTAAEDFVVTGPRKPSLAAGASASFKVVFKPGAKGIRNATIRVMTNDLNEESFDINLTGIGAAR